MSKFDPSKIPTYQAGVAQASMHRALQKICDDILRPFGITKMHWLLIGTVLETGNKGARISDLADKLGTTVPYLTNTINLLEKKNILVRKNNKEDSRSKLISIDPSFLPHCEKIEETLRKGLREAIYSHVDPGEFRIYLKVLYELKEVGDKTLKNS